MLSPQKNRSGQRSYRRRDVEISLRIKQLLYEEMFTIAGAKKKLQAEMRESPKLKIVHPEPRTEDGNANHNSVQGFLEDDLVLEERDQTVPQAQGLTPERRDALKSLATQLLELRQMLKTSLPREAEDRSRNRQV